MILLIGPRLQPVTGQSIAFSTLKRGLDEDNVHAIEYAASNNIFWHVLFSIKFVFEFLSALLRFRNVSCVYFTSSRSSFGFIRDAIIVLSSYWCSKKIVNHLHGSDFSTFRTNSLVPTNIIDYVYNRITCSIVLSDSMKEHYSCYPNMKVFTVANFSSLELEYKVDKKSARIKVLYLSNLLYSKGVIHLVNAIKELPSDKFELVVAGCAMGDLYRSKDEIWREFESSIKGCANIKYLGTVEGKEKERLFTSSDIFCLPTFYPTEAQPISILEAMSKGCYIVSTDQGYIPELLSNTGNSIVKSDSKSSLIEELSCLADSKERLKIIGKANVDLVNREYTVDRYVNKIKVIVGA